MYNYDQYDQAMVDARVDEFRDQARRRFEGKITEDQFSPLRLMNGLYLQLHAYMLRVAIPYGTLTARRCMRWRTSPTSTTSGYGHFTTRQNIQYNWIKLDEAADLLADLAKVEMHAIQTSGNCIRNISFGPFCRAPRRMKWWTRAPMPNCCGSGPASTPNSATCRASSRSR